MSRFNGLYLAYLISLSKHSRKLTKNPNNGFTLLELLISVVIIGVLAAIAIPSYVAIVDNARYAEAKIQMGCLKGELEGYRIEYGYFPDDVNNNTVPTGIECFYRQNSMQVPFNSRYDYENWSVSGGCVIQITFFGKNGVRNTLANTNAYQAPGFHKFRTNDDLILSLGVQEPSVCSS